MGFFSKFFGGGAKPEKDKDFPPVPAWEPAIKIREDQIIDRFRYYTDHKNDFVVFRHGTCVLVPEGLSDTAAKEEAKAILSKIFNYHPDMNPVPMDDGNMLVRYNHPAFNVVLEDLAQEHIASIRANHLKALARDEVLITSLGQNQFDEFGMKALWGRCYFFMDAKDPVVSKIVRRKS
ncbi:hypothetical protein [Haloferula sp. BvORR071]|uniref:hypothetical protein n=1 Tax=Haloferula sp. BvORR071 TaxID=1396141 RepID=UPI0005589CF2|nr:hypothetical protein [Haloferula sp. BvORR071]